MTLCPIALAVGCHRCFAVSFCPLKGVIGDYKKDLPAQGNESEPKAPGPDADASTQPPANEE